MSSDDEQYDYEGDSGEDVYPDFDEPSYGGDDGDDDDNNGFGHGYASDEPDFNKETADKPDYGYKGLDNTSTMTTNKTTGPTTNTYELTRRSNTYDNQSGSYIRGTAKDSYSSGDYSNHGRLGYKDQYTSSSKLRVGDKRGYTEYFKQEKETRVEYHNPNTYLGAGKSSNNNSGGGGGGGWLKRYKR